VTRFKELKRIENALEHRDQAELRWLLATAKCAWKSRREKNTASVGAKLSRKSTRL
jgi:hypothetical protein